MVYNNIFYKSALDLSGSEKRDIYLTEEERYQINNKPFNFLVVHNASDKLMLISLNRNYENEVIPVVANGGTFSISKDDKILFSDVSITNANVNASTGKVYVTMGVI